MKLVKLSLSAVLAAGLATHSLAADTLADAFKNGKVNGELRAWYWDRDTGDNNPTSYTGASKNTSKGNADLLDFAVILNYVTDKLYGFSLGATVASNYAPFANQDAKNVFGADEYGSGAVFSEAYLGYQLGKTDVKIGRQYISTPLILGSSTRIVKESFEGATVVNTNLPDTTLYSGYVSKFQGRTTSIAKDQTLDNIKIGEFRKKVTVISGGTKFKDGNVKSIPEEMTFDGAYTLGGTNKSIPNLTLSAQFAQADDVANDVVGNGGDVKLYYTEANYLLPLSHFSLGLDAIFRAGDVDDKISPNFSGHYSALRVSVKDFAGFGTSLAYGTTSKNDDAIYGFGGGPSSYTSTLIRASKASLGANTDSYRFDVSYDFAKLGITGFKALASYGLAKQGYVNGVFSSAATDQKDYKYTSYATGLTYEVPAVKGLNLELLYETQEKESKPISGAAKTSQDTDELRFKANYKF